MNIYVAYSLYKLAHVSKYLHCSELFAIEKSTIHLVLHEFMCAMNIVLKNQMKWPKGNDLIEVMARFKNFYDMSSVHGTIDATRIHVQKLTTKIFATNFYFFKSKGYIIHMEDVVDHQKELLRSVCWDSRLCQ